MTVDGATASKPTPGLSTEHPTVQKPVRKPSKLRRYMSIGSRARPPPSKAAKPSEPSAPAPLQLLSPRPTEFEPWAKRHTKRSLSTLLLPRSTSARPSDPSPTGADGARLAAQGRVSGSETGAKPEETHVSAAASAWQARQDSARKMRHSMPASLGRNAALTSHPVGGEDLDSDEEFQTPAEFVGREAGDCVEK